MDVHEVWRGLAPWWGLAPALLMGLLAAVALMGSRGGVARLWPALHGVSAASLVLAGLALLWAPRGQPWPGVLAFSTWSLAMALLVQLLGTVIARFSARYLEGEAGQRRYIAALAAVLAAVQVLLQADHWAVLIAAWAAVGLALRPLLCFYPDRPFALLAAHKKHIADRLADALLLLAAGLAWWEVGSGSLSALQAHVQAQASSQGLSPALHIAALALVLAVVLRTALLPVHGWLIQVMEAPTPVSALLHAGVVNLGGLVLIRFAPLLEQALPARSVLALAGLLTAVLAGMVMLTRISIKVRLAWSTVAQMGFMLLECALGLYTLAALHLVGHSLYKAHTFLSASGVVRQTRLRSLQPRSQPAAWSLWLAPVLSVSLVLALPTPWPWWWSAVLGLAWAPLLWLPACAPGAAPHAAPLGRYRLQVQQALAGVLMVLGLSGLALAVHGLPLGLQDAPQTVLGGLALLGMGGLYLGLAVLQRWPQHLTRWRRWSYAGFYVDEAYTRLALRLWPTEWAPAAATPWPADAARSALAPVRR